LLRLARVQGSRHAALASQLRQTQTVRSEITCALSDRQLTVERLQREVRVGHVGDERRDDGPPRLLCGEILTACRLVQPADPSPDVQFPCEAESRLEVRDVGAESWWERPRANVGYAILRGTGGSHDQRQSIGPCDPKSLTGLHHTLRRDPQIEVLSERDANELGQRVVLEQIEPAQVCQ